MASESKNKTREIQIKEKVYTTIPFGSQHVALPEPIKFIFDTENEIVKEIKFDIAYVHRGIEKALTTMFDFRKAPYVVGRVCGICSAAHTIPCAVVMERAIGIDREIPDRAKAIRMIALEINRLQSHFLINGHLAEVCGYENVFMHIWRDREMIMDLADMLFGNRVQYDVVCVGGVNRDIPKDKERVLLDKLNEIEKSVEFMEKIFTKDRTLVSRLKGLGVVSKEMALEYGVVGPVARASGVKTDCRVEDDWGLYKDLGFEMVMMEEGDSLARCLVRVRECYESIRMIREAIKSTEEGEISIKVTANPKYEAVCRNEAPRGELFYYVKGTGDMMPDRVRIRTPTLANIPILPEVMKDVSYNDIPPLLMSFDPCLSCTGR